MRSHARVALCTAALVLTGAGDAVADPPTGGAFVPNPTAPAAAPVAQASLAADGRTGLAPAGAPPAVQAAIAAANRINRRPYRYGGGHGRFRDSGYDCSGSVSYVLHGAGLLGRPLSSGGLMHWAAPGRGRWITVYAHPSHTFLVIRGRRYDTTGRSASGSRWQPAMRSTAGYVARHPPGL